MTELPQPPNDLRLRAVLPASPKIVYEALTDPAALRVWLTEHAEVELPDRYEFWGPSTPDGAQPHQRLLHADERTIRFAWTVDGVETTTRFDLAEDEDGTQVTLTQSDLPSFEEVLADTAGARGALQTFWSLAIANLADYLSDRALTPRCDFTSAELRAEVVIDAAPEAVFDSMVQPEQFHQWFGANVDIEPYVGGRFAMGGFDLDPGGARFVEFEPGRKATLRFADGETTSWELDGSDGKTRLTLIHSGFDPANPPYPGWAGWLGGISALRRYHELSRARSIWREVAAPGLPEGMLAINP
ncbi:SRPBCC domain-containing protein [Actinophytocola sp.]|uniref:SRPBCC domain-containing protein n=1 Tax=Actinophytocola sp. TaxID=1872138 RepID=UPI002D8042C4|nr:SRPBCC domain-containing protein [Actinophytocola sp.]HET9142647.1 SRPBCC domain-containing protein [Actinophytocola sp.]